MTVEIPVADTRSSRAAVSVARDVTRPTPRSRRSRLAVVSAILLTITCLLMVFPFLWAALSSTKPTDVAFANPPVFAYTPTFTPYVDLWQTTDFYLYLTNTMVVAVISTLVALLVGIPCAYALSRYGGIASIILLVLALVMALVLQIRGREKEVVR